MGSQLGSVVIGSPPCMSHLEGVPQPHHGPTNHWNKSWGSWREFLLIEQGGRTQAEEQDCGGLKVYKYPKFRCDQKKMDIRLIWILEFLYIDTNMSFLSTLGVCTATWHSTWICIFPHRANNYQNCISLDRTDLQICTHMIIIVSNTFPLEKKDWRHEYQIMMVHIPLRPAISCKKRGIAEVCILKMPWS